MAVDENWAVLQSVAGGADQLKFAFVVKAVVADGQVDVAHASGLGRVDVGHRAVHADDGLDAHACEGIEALGPLRDAAGVVAVVVGHDVVKPCVVAGLLVGHGGGCHGRDGVRYGLFGGAGSATEGNEQHSDIDARTLHPTPSLFLVDGCMLLGQTRCTCPQFSRESRGLSSFAHSSRDCNMLHFEPLQGAWGTGSSRGVWTAQTPSGKLARV